MFREIKAGDISEAPEDDLFQVVTKVFETQEEFIFQTIQPFCERQAHMVITKDKLIRALTLLREQEPVKPEREYSGGGTTWWNVCGACMTAINPNDKYCHECGRGIKWDA